MYAINGIYNTPQLKMRVLFVSIYFPTERMFVNGPFKRMRIFIDAIKEVASLDILFFVPPNIDVSPSSVSDFESDFSKQWNAEISLFMYPRFQHQGRVSIWRSRWQHYGASVLSFFSQEIYGFTSGPQQVQAFESLLDRKPDAIFVHRLASMCPPLLTRKRLPKIFFDLDDIESIKFLRIIRQKSSLHKKFLFFLQAPALWWGERQAIKMAYRTFVCSELDRRYLANRCNLRGIVTVPNAVPIPKLESTKPDCTLLFLGSYSYEPNVDAAEFLIGKVWSRIYGEMPSARLIIAGPWPNRIPSFDQNLPGVEFTGFVEDLDGLYNRSQVVCAPVFTGAGTRIKIIEAAVYGKPIVATRFGAEGIELLDGYEILLRNSPESFADACLKLLMDPELCERLGSAARSKSIQFYDQNKITRLIQGYLNNDDYEVDSREFGSSK